MIINPKKDCWWARRRLTENRYSDSSFRGSGTSLRVLSHIFLENNCVWYSKPYGKQNNSLLFIALQQQTESRRTSKDLSRIASPLPSFLQKSLKIEFEDNDYQIGQTDLIKYQLSIHEDCYFYIEPVDRNLLKTAMLSILQQHSYYLRQDTNWSYVIDDVTDTLIRSEKVEMLSNPDNMTLTISTPKAKNSFLNRLVGKTSSYTIHIEEKTARFANPVKFFTNADDRPRLRLF